jgi:hypothetical protein
VRRFFITLVVVFGVGVTGALWLRDGRVRRNNNASRAVKDVTKKRTLEVPSLPVDPVQTGQDDNEISDRGDVAKVREMIEMRNVAINFWGKVIDQDGSPLPGVRIDYTYSIYHGNDQGVAWVDFEAKKGETVSDGDGLFAITDLKGHDLTIESLTKLGYVHRERWQLAYNFYGEMPELKFEPRQDKPVRVTMIRTTATESLVHVKGGVNVSGNGAVERWNLWTGESDANGELAITLKRDPAIIERPDQLVAWSADLQVIGGGIIEAPWDEEVRRAPESGYLATAFYPKTEQKPGSPYRSFYLRTADDRYGRIQVTLYASDDGPTARCFITGDMNPRPGSRNLEPSEYE